MQEMSLENIIKIINQIKKSKNNTKYKFLMKAYKYK